MPAKQSNFRTGLVRRAAPPPKQRQCLAWDIERGQSNETEPLPWQTDTCLGDWHYNRAVHEHHGYKSAKNVIHTLVDVVSKNGNLLLNVPVRGNGTIDEQECAIVDGLAVVLPAQQPNDIA